MKSTRYVKQEEVFTQKNTVIFKIIATILFVDSVAYIAGNMVFMFLEWNPFAVVSFATGILGIIIAMANYTAYRYLLKATTIKEENDSIL